MKFYRAKSRESGFTMIEIAVCLTVIVIGLVAVLGSLPAGLNTQKKNREESIIEMEARYFLEAMRNGATNFAGGRVVMGISRTNFPISEPLNWKNPADRDKVIGFLCATNEVTKAKIGTLSGNAAEKSTAIGDPMFGYLLTSEIVPFTSFLSDPTPTSESYKEGQQVQANLWEIRLTFEWPLYPTNRIIDGREYLAGINKKTFRALTSGRLEKTQVKTSDGALKDYYLFRPTTFQKVNTP